MSPYEGDGDIEQERAEEVNDVKPGGDRRGEREKSISVGES